MVRLSPIVSLDDSRLQPYKEMRQQYDQYQQEIFVAEGDKVMHRVLESDVQIVSALLLPKWLNEFEPLFAKRPEAIELFTAERPLLENLIGYKHYQGLLAVCRVPCPSSIEQVIARAPRPSFFVATDEIKNAEKLGVIVRNAAAL